MSEYGTKRLIGEFSGAFADLGTFLPIAIAVLTLHLLDPSGLFVGFGLFALAVALIYRRPIPVQPMKAVAAIVIADNLTAGTIAATGLILGATVLLLTVTGLVTFIGRKIPHTVLSGIQLGVGLILAWAGAKLIIQDPLTGLAAMLLLLLLLPTRLKPFAAILVIVAASIWSIASLPDPLPEITIGLHLPHWVSIDWSDAWIATESILLPQLALTLTNAMIVTAVIAGRLFADQERTITPSRLGMSTGILNLLLAPLGAFPMCHGAGGLVVQHRFGARTGIAPAIFGATCLAIGLLLGPNALQLLLLIPLAAVGALLVYAGLDLAKSRELTQGSWEEMAVIIITGLVCLLLNVALGLLVGIVAEYLRRRWGKQPSLNI
ncbi:MAG: putative sulfate/molybdate transporter [Candidatus Thiodiazotropha sp. (ex Ctena orbiculata)]|uniref:Sulfate/molybdate transporter n=1 Tax=Candidatus Thiodiazotropha taylori TaxID=2792791 RepID=A0A944M8E1_9GAMM|nr:putative sulfate/molybdate transporter [Candidatus Thiodiazotropha taylori]MBT2989301.1 putative sulfate/molybdate transporter [Candidatus Thiodiazotropha taylori]MBT2996881.1 putative sulfate/molybdate transporter [Candidatus Thiodiazotropha taylori]MBT3000736.1 putative sulfate/molybdate transporter [Candidatus Thiodiazotropha taylori]MBT3029405.1 putative sulfate/molybdate transporter [Candidatus Thiodiazotropha taylori]